MKFHRPALALAASLCAHALLLTTPTLRLVPQTEPPALEVRLLPAPPASSPVPPAPPVPPAANPIPAAPTPAARASRDRPVRTLEPEAPIPPPAPNLSAVPEAKPPATIPTPAPTPAETPETAAPEARVATTLPDAPAGRPRTADRPRPAAADASAIAPPAAVHAEAASPALPKSPEPAPPDALPAHLPPAEVRLDYVLTYGDQGLVVGTAQYDVRIQGERYTLSSVVELTGLFALIRSGRLVQTSHGRLTAQGFRPEAYWVQRGQDAGKTEFAQFDYAAGRVWLGGRGQVALPDGAQDLLSFIYQLGVLRPAPGRLQLPIATGRKLREYRIDVLGAETVATAAGELPALHVRKAGDGDDDAVDLWLGTALSHLPVKIRLTSPDGKIAEQSLLAWRVTPAAGTAGLNAGPPEPAAGMPPTDHRFADREKPRPEPTSPAAPDPEVADPEVADPEVAGPEVTQPQVAGPEAASPAPGDPEPARPNPWGPRPWATEP